MKKILVRVTAALLSAGVLTAAGNTIFAQQSSITAEQAKAIALADAKANAKDVVFIRTQRDMENGSQVYDIEFYVGNKEYDYEISVANGTIVQKDMDIENFVTPTQTKPAKPNTNAVGSKAKQVALKHANLKESQVQHLIEKVDDENGRKVIEVKFYSGGKEYSYEIDAQTNAIREWDVEYDDYYEERYHDVDDDDYYEDRYDDVDYDNYYEDRYDEFDDDYDMDDDD